MAGPAPRRAHDGGLLGVAPNQPADHLSVDHESGEGRDEPEDAQCDGFGPDGALGFGDVGSVRALATGGTEVGDDLVHGRDDGCLVRQSSVEMERDVGVVGAARLELPGQSGGDHRDPVAERGIVVLDDLGAPFDDPHEFEGDDAGGACLWGSRRSSARSSARR